MTVFLLHLVSDITDPRIRSHHTQTFNHLNASEEMLVAAQSFDMRPSVAINTFLKKLNCWGYLYGNLSLFFDDCLYFTSKLCCSILFFYKQDYSKNIFINKHLSTNS